MKKLLLGTIALAVTVTGAEAAGDPVWSENLLPLAAYEMESKRILRVYEFRSKVQPNIFCIFVEGNERGGLDCMEISPSTDQPVKPKED